MLERRKEPISLATTDNIENAIKQALVALAKDVVKKAGEVDILPDKVDALKTLTAVYVALKKHKTDDPDEDQGNGFDFSKGVMPEEPPNVTTLPARRRPG